MNISFALTTQQFRNRTKTVTRRLGWRKLKPGQVLDACEKCRGLKKGEHPVKLGKIRVKSVRFERLDTINRDLDYGFEEVKLEGFPFGSKWPSEFTEKFCSHNNCARDVEITRIEYEYL